jgi:hypothetical protein
LKGYSTTANLHNSQITTAPAKPFPARYIFTSRSVATASNSGVFSASRAQDLSSQSPLQNPTLKELSINWVVKFKVTLRLTASQSVNLGVEPHLGLTTLKRI